jgi:CheY-like chemotaxis protein
MGSLSLPGPPILHRPTAATLRILIVDESIERAIRLAQALRPLGSIRTQRVAGPTDLRAALIAGAWDATVVGVNRVSDALEPLNVTRAAASGCPTVVVSEGDDAHAALRMIRAGAADVLLEGADPADGRTVLAERVRVAVRNVRDLERARTLERERDESQELLDMLIDIGGCSQFTWVLAHERVEFRPPLSEVLENPALDAFRQPTDLLDLVHDDDRATVLRDLRMCLEQARDGFAVSLRVVVDGSEQTVRLRARAFRDAEGRVVRIAGAIAPVRGSIRPSAVTRAATAMSRPSDRQTAIGHAAPDAQRKLRILLVEDEDLLRRMATMILSDIGYVVESAADAETALEEWRNDDPPDLLITDVMLPGMSGPQLVAELRARNPALPVIYTSGYGDAAFTERGIDAERVNMLPKPYSTSDLASRVRDVLGHAALAA